MTTTLNQDEIIVKVFNNNIVLVNSDKKEKIFFSKGIGFGKKPGSVIESGKTIEKIFVIEDEENIKNFKNAIDYIEEEFFAICEEAIYDISKKCDREFNERIHIGLVDHLYFAVKRLKNNEQIENPFLIEIKTLYAMEFSLAKIVAKRISEYSKVDIPEGEIGLITLHIHTALNDGSISNTLRNTQLNNEIAEYVEDRLKIKIDRNSIDYARFCTHIRFAIQRILDNVKNKNELVDIVKNTYKISYDVSQGVAKIIEKEYNMKVSEDEIAYLTIHIERFNNK